MSPFSSEDIILSNILGVRSIRGVDVSLAQCGSVFGAFMKKQQFVCRKDFNHPHLLLLRPAF